MRLNRSDALLDGQISLSPLFFAHVEVFPKKCILQYGHVKQEVEIVIDESVSRDTLLLSKTVIAKVTIPTCISFQTKWDGRTLSIGPVIAFFTVGTVNALTANLERFLPYFSIYPHFRGLVYICACDGVDRNTKTIHGYYYDYHDQNNPWKEGTFPYPNTIYRKTGFSRALYNEFVSELGDNIFNTYFFNKWELWEWLAQSTKCSQFLPFTEKLMNNATQLEQLLETFDEVYLKQVDGHKAKGIIKVFKDELGTHFKYRLKGERVLQTKEEIEAFLNDINVRKNYLVQQSIPIKRFEARNFDFRVIMQRNRTGKWICTANIARFGKKDSIATNFLLAGFALPGVEAIKKVFDLQERDAFKKEQEMIQACTVICEQLSNCCGNYGDVGVDVILDENQKVWVLEVNKLHDHKFPLYALEDEQMYYKVITTPFEYASYLAGF